MERVEICSQEPKYVYSTKRPLPNDTKTLACTKYNKCAFPLLVNFGLGAENCVLFLNINFSAERF